MPALWPSHPKYNREGRRKFYQRHNRFARVLIFLIVLALLIGNCCNFVIVFHIANENSRKLWIPLCITSFHHKTNCIILIGNPGGAHQSYGDIPTGNAAQNPKKPWKKMLSNFVTQTAIFYYLSDQCRPGSARYFSPWKEEFNRKIFNMGCFL